MFVLDKTCRRAPGQRAAAAGRFHSDGRELDVSAGCNGALVVYVIALPFVFALGLALFLLFSKFRMFNWWGSILAGGLSGIAIEALLGDISNLRGYPLLLYVATGAATGIAFWGVVILAPEPNQSTARNWVAPLRRRRL
jgi:hypothetical protein